MPTANESLLDASVRHQVGLMRLSTATIRKVIALLGRTEEDLVRQLLRYDPTEVAPRYSQQRLEKLLEAVREVNKEAYAALRAQLDGDLRDLAVYEAEFQKRMLQSSVPIRLDLVSPTATQLHAAVNSRPFQGRFLREWYAQLEEGAQRRLRDAIRIGFTEGETIGQMVRRVRGTAALNYRDGILEVSRRGAEGLVRTATNHTASASRSELYRQNSEVIKGVRWVATLDGRTTLVCASRDGEVYPLDSGPRPPAHFNCRSTTAPVLKSWKEMGIRLSEAPEGTRASMDGQVPGKTSYNEWLRRQDKEFQDDVLGPTKARLYREGNLDLDRFVDRTGKEYTLDELRRREAEAFERAGL